MTPFFYLQDAILRHIGLPDIHISRILALDITTRFIWSPRSMKHNPTYCVILIFGLLNRSYKIFAVDILINTIILCCLCLYTFLYDSKPIKVLAQTVIVFLYKYLAAHSRVVEGIDEDSVDHVLAILVTHSVSS